jgi:hypothetical protein
MDIPGQFFLSTRIRYNEIVLMEHIKLCIGILRLYFIYTEQPSQRTVGWVFEKDDGEGRKIKKKTT